jgi:hypothetical protein
MRRIHTEKKICEGLFDPGHPWAIEAHWPDIYLFSGENGVTCSRLLFIHYILLHRVAN